MGAKMKAARLHVPGEPFSVDDVDVPEPRYGEVLIEVGACGVVPNMQAVTSGTHWYTLPPLPAIYGLDAAGTIRELGEGVHGWKAGDRVYVNPALAAEQVEPQLYARSFALRGYFGAGPLAEALLAEQPGGGFAEFTTAPAGQLVRLPDGVSFEQGARYGYLGTAYAALKRAGAGPARTVLVNGATGTLGVGAVLLALAMGATRIVASGRDRARLAQLAALDPARISAHALADGPIAVRARDVTGGRGVDAVIDCAGRGTPAATVLDGLQALAHGGTAVLAGAYVERMELDPMWFLVHETRVTGSLWFTVADGEEMGALARAGLLRLDRLHDEPYPLARVNDALARAAGRVGGFVNIVVIPR